MDLRGKTALVTGSGAGMGRGCGLELARRGARIVVNDKPGPSSSARGSGVSPVPGVAEKTAGEIRALGVEALAIEADAFDAGSCEWLVSQVLDQWGRIDILIACPAFSIRKPLVEYEVEEFDRTVEGTFLSYFYIARPVARHMIARGGGGKILFLSSVRSFLPYANSAPYNAAKAAVNQMAFTLANELAPHRVNVNVLEPGWTDTPGERLFYSDEYLREVGATLPWGRLGTPEDIGKAAAFLCSDDADYITAAVLRVDGGIWIRNLTRPAEGKA